jgi:hypothetical protein
MNPSGLKLLSGSPMYFARYENKWILVCRVRSLFDSLRTGGFFVESLRRENGSDIGGNFWRALCGVGFIDAPWFRLVLVRGIGVHGVFGGGVQLARGSWLDGVFGGRAEVVRGLAHLADAGGFAGFDRCAGEKPIKFRDLFTFLGWEHFSRRLEGLNCRYLLDR